MPKKIPMRMCVVCRTMLEKAELLRLVRTEDGVVIDTTGKLAGRGAYICKNPECIAKCAKKRILDRAFNEKLPDGIYEKLLSDYAGLTKNN